MRSFGPVKVRTQRHGSGAGWLPRTGLSASAAIAVLAAVVLAGPLPGPAAAAAAPCLRYGEVVTLTGSYFALKAPAADGIVRRAATDTARRADLLVLDESYCVDADTLSTSIRDASTIQLDCPAVEAPDGGVVSLTGKIRGARTGNGHIPVLLSCQK
jgi:hypothetical protein